MTKETLKAPYSHYLLSAELSQEVDRRTIEEADIDGFTLMEIAGFSAAKIILREQTDLSHGVFLCGKGNNAGDALVIARYLLQNGIAATLIFISGTGDLSADTQKNLELLKHFDAENRTKIIKSWDKFDDQTDFDFIVDGMLGTGLNSDVRSNYAKAVKWINKQNKPVFAIDIPTGLHSDSGAIMGCAVQANHTFALGGKKQGFYLEKGPFLTGSITYCELPFPNKYKESSSTYLLDENWIRSETPTPLTFSSQPSRPRLILLLSLRPLS
jgi:NAD(P)H-hydrate epimerase